MQHTYSIHTANIHTYIHTYIHTPGIYISPLSPPTHQPFGQSQKAITIKSHSMTIKPHERLIPLHHHEHLDPTLSHHEEIPSNKKTTIPLGCARICSVSSNSCWPWDGLAAPINSYRSWWRPYYRMFLTSKPMMQRRRCCCKRTGLGDFLWEGIDGVNGIWTRVTGIQWRCNYCNYWKGDSNGIEWDNFRFNRTIGI